MRIKRANYKSNLSFVFDFIEVSEETILNRKQKRVFLIDEGITSKYILIKYSEQTPQMFRTSHGFLSYFLTQ